MKVNVIFANVYTCYTMNVSDRSQFMTVFELFWSQTAENVHASKAKESLYYAHSFTIIFPILNMQIM